MDLRCGHVLDVLATLEPGSVQCCVTSPPYWGLRDYGTGGVVWGGDPECDHEWGEDGRSSQRNRNKQKGSGLRDGSGEDWTEGSAMLHPKTGRFCQKCGAWHGELGLEPTPELYVEHLVEVFRAVRRVLRDDGTLWLNLGDSYNAYNSNRGSSAGFSDGKDGGGPSGRGPRASD